MTQLPEVLSPDEVRIEDPSFYFDPWRVYAQLRATDPVFWYEPLNMWVLTTFEDLRQVASTPELFTSSHGALLNDAIQQRAAGAMTGGQSDNPSAAFFEEDSFISTADGPPHIAMRKAMAAAFAPRKVAAKKDAVGTYIDALLAAVTPGETFDFYEGVACKLPVWSVIHHVGFDDLSVEELRSWTDTVDAVGQPVSLAELEHAATVILSVVEYVGQKITERDGRDNSENMVEVILRQQEVSPAVARNLVTAVLLAGATSTRALLCSIMYALARHPEQFAAAKADPTLAVNIVEETLRWSPPVMSFIRTATRDTELHGKKISAGDRMMLLFHAANHDDERFPDPERFDIQRPNSTDHVAFGFGPHRCPGMQLARLETVTFVEKVLERYSRIEVAVEPERANSYLGNAFSGLQLRLS